MTHSSKGHSITMQHSNFRSTRTVLTLLVLVSLFLTACGNAAPNPSNPTTFTVGIVNGTQSLARIPDDFKGGMTELGYVEGKNVVYRYSGVITKAEELEAEAKSLVDSKVHMIFAVGIAATRAVKKVTAGTDLPVVFAPTSNPVKLGFVQSMSNPEGNLTGIASGEQYPIRALEYYSKLVPTAKRVFIVYNTADTTSAFLPAVKEAASTLGLELVLQTIQNNDEVTAVIKNIPADVDVIFNLPDSLVAARLKDFVEAAIARKLPLLSFDKSKVEAGCLLAYGWDYVALAKQAARISDRVLKGAKPSSLAIESPEFYLSLNLKTAAAIGLNIPDDIIRQASTVVR
jgi:putative ABC transport system substrate-binding protein